MKLKNELRRNTWIIRQIYACFKYQGQGEEYTHRGKEKFSSAQNSALKRLKKTRRFRQKRLNSGVKAKVLHWGTPWTCPSFLSPCASVSTDTPALSWSTYCLLKTPNHFNGLKLQPWSICGWFPITHVKTNGNKRATPPCGCSTQRLHTQVRFCSAGISRTALSLTLRRQCRHRLKWIQSMVFSTWLADNISRLSLQSCSRKSVLGKEFPEVGGLTRRTGTTAKDGAEVHGWLLGVGGGEGRGRQEGAPACAINHILRWMYTLCWTHILTWTAKGETRLGSLSLGSFPPHLPLWPHI